MREVRGEILSEFRSDLGVLLPVDWVICWALGEPMERRVEGAIMEPVMVAIRSVIEGGTREDA